MFQATATLTSLSEYTQSKFVTDDRKDGESFDEFQERIWKQKAHTTATGEIFIPPMAIKLALNDAAKFLGIKIKGRGNSNFTKRFVSGVLIEKAILTGKYIDKDAFGKVLFMNLGGVPGTGNRGNRTFPTILKWSGTATFDVFDGEISKDIFLKHLTAAGIYIGIGQHRPSNRGTSGRFTVTDLQWNEVGHVLDGLISDDQAEAA